MGEGGDGGGGGGVLHVRFRPHGPGLAAFGVVIALFRKNVCL